MTCRTAAVKVTTRTDARAGKTLARRSVTILPYPRGERKPPPPPRQPDVAAIARAAVCEDCDHYEDYQGARAPTCEMIRRLRHPCPKLYAQTLRSGDPPCGDCLWMKEVATCDEH